MKHSEISGYQQFAATEIFEDNLACIVMSENPVRRKFSRHIHIRRYFIRELVKIEIEKFVQLRTHKMVADALTKSLSLPAIVAHCNVMLGHVSIALKITSNYHTYISTIAICSF